MKGTYILVIFISDNIEVIIGSMGMTLFEKGIYLYIGSGMGNKGSSSLERRVNRHILPFNKKKSHWHIDYLLNQNGANIIQIYLIPAISRLECIIANEIKNCSDSYIKGFGSSDCQCKSHLFYFKQFEEFRF